MAASGGYSSTGSKQSAGTIQSAGRQPLGGLSFGLPRRNSGTSRNTASASGQRKVTVASTGDILRRRASSGGAGPPASGLRRPAATAEECGAEEYWKMQVHFLRTLQERNLQAAYDCCVEIERRWPGHPNAKAFRDVMKIKVEELAEARAAGLCGGDDDSDDDDEEEEDEEDESDEDEEEEEEEEDVARPPQTDPENAKALERWERQMAENDLDGMKKELEALGILSSKPPAGYEPNVEVQCDTNTAAKASTAAASLLRSGGTGQQKRAAKRPQSGLMKPAL